MASTAHPVEYSFDWLVRRFHQLGLVAPQDARNALVQEAQQRLRVQRQAAIGTGAKNYRVSPAELLASFQFTAPTGVELGEDRIAAVLANEAGLSYRKIDPLELDMGFITRTLPRAFAARHVVLPLSEESGTLVIAVDNPFDVELLENLRRVYPGNIKKVVASKQDILKCITEIYGFRKSVESAAKEAKGRNAQSFEQLVRLKSVGEMDSNDQHVVNAVEFLFRYAFDQRASDIHIEPRRGDSQVRLRIDGVLHNVHTIPRAVHPAVTSRLKTLARMDIAEKRRPQDGRIKTVLGEREVELRVSCLPVAFGEKIVIRIFDPNVLVQSLPDLGFPEGDLDVFQKWIGHPHGMVLITGPTGSGKTTTLYTTLQRLKNDSINITTVEDPIEMVTDAFNQVQAQSRIGVDFAAALRSILRQDPDVIMIGEIRDGETGKMAVQAALTGHLVFSTLHTNDTVAAVTRLVDLGVEPYLVSSTLLGVMAQRLVRRICDDCKEPAPLSNEEFEVLGIGREERDAYTGTMKGAGCVKCRGTGYRGRVGVFELLNLDDDLLRALQHGQTEDDLRQLARSKGLTTLREAALERLAQGQTTFDELVRVTGLLR
ncbi:MAG: ATPase, T2SS/T4P/T4SS family [Myxococcota bacterium]